MNHHLRALLLSFCLMAGITASSGARERPVITGTVTDTRGRPLSGVVVTDGFTHAETNKAGRFRIVSPHPDRVRFVSARIPSGYRPVLKEGRAEFFAPVGDYTGRKREAAIVLEKDPAPSDDYTVLMMADPQAKPYQASAKNDNIAYAATDIWEDLFADLKARIAKTTGPCFGICLGDIGATGSGARKDAAVYTPYRRGMESLRIPFFQVIGNHDHFYEGAEDDDAAARLFEDTFGPRNYSFDIGKVHFVVIDDCIYIKNLRRYPFLYGIEDGFLEWLKSDLARVPKDMPVMVCSHADLFNSDGIQDWVYDDMKCAYKLSDALAALQGFDKLYFWAGHTHTCSFLGKVRSPDNPSGIETFVIGRSSGCTPTNEYVSHDGTPRGFVVLEVHGKEFSWKFHPLESNNATFRGKTAPEFKWKPEVMDESFQLHAYPRGAYDDDYVYANIFLWDPSWSVPVLRIGDKTYPMRKDYLYDLSFKEIVQFYNKNAGTRSSYSIKGLHHFLVRVPDEARGRGTVEVTDRFGNTWKADVSIDPTVYLDGRLHLSFDLRGKDALTASAESGHPLVLSGGRYSAATETEEGYWELSGEGCSLTLPALPGYRLSGVTVHPSGNTMREQSARIVSETGESVPGGGPLLFMGNASDTWELEGTLPGASCRILSEKAAFRISEIRLAYEKE